MSYTYPTKVYPIGADVDAVALELAQRQSASGTTNGGIAGVPAVPQLGVDPAGMGLAYLKAIADATLCAVGYQGQSHAQASMASSTSETSYVDVPGFSSWTFAAPIAKTYLVAVDCSAFLSGFTNVLLDLRLMVGGVAAGERSFLFHNSDWALPMSFRIPAAMVKGNNVVKLQWRMGSGVTASTLPENFRTFTVSG